MKLSQNLAVVLTAAVLMWSCASKSEEEKAREEPKNALEALQKIADEAEKMSKEGPKETIDPKLLKELLPASADGLKRTEASSEKNAAMGFGVSTAKGTYTNGSSEKIDVSIVDCGGMGTALMSMAAWSIVSIDQETRYERPDEFERLIDKYWSMVSTDKETKRGYEKTTEYKGHKAFEKYDDKNGEIAVLIANRYLVQVEGNNVSIDKIKSVLKDIDLDKLSKL
ncbi:MAG: transposase [Cytophagia bacterium]|nr:MAG: transposase [Runella sp.]TAG19207.1 MAG: transposase [Cytophagales bacterium]TAG38475.1 MAG: transposase [Cytophagia bacterium]TAG50809.1 MAG: transposase [Runella slithyformis]TAG72026.1 MAG: transposase [Runella slithyformis]